MRNIWIDTESVGLCGPVTMVQWLEDGENEPHILDLPPDWKGDEARLAAVRRILDLCWSGGTRLFMFNAPHDTFKLCQLYHDLLGRDQHSFDRPVPPPLSTIIDLSITAARHADFSAFALAKSGRSVAAIRRIPAVVAEEVADYVESRLRSLVPPIFEFCRSWHEVQGHPELVSCSWAVNGRLGLKQIMKHYGIPTLDLRDCYPIPERGEEIQIHPYTQPCHERIMADCYRVVADKGNTFWKYAKLDPIYTRILWDRLGQPTSEDSNDAVSAMVGYTRYAGFPLDQDRLESLHSHYACQLASCVEAFAGVDLESNPQRVALLQSYDPLIQASNRKVLESIAYDEGHPAQAVARKMMRYKQYAQRLIQIDTARACRTGRLHAFVRVLGTGSNRTSGTGGFNLQGIGRLDSDPRNRDLRPSLREAVFVSAGGDFDSLEMNIMGPAYGDKQLTQDMVDKIDPHVFAATCFPTDLEGLPYEEAYQLYKSKDPRAKTARTTAKTGNYAIGYGANVPKVAEVFHCSEQQAERGLAKLFARWSGLGEGRAKIARDFCTADVETWSPSSIAGMRESIESMLNFPRSFKFEKLVCEVMWKIGCSGVPLSRHGFVVRNQQKGEQTYHQAVRSACLGAVTTIQQAVARAAGNHVIQATGAEITKGLAGIVWKAYRLPCMVIHDEVQYGFLPDGSRPDVLGLARLVEKVIGFYRRIVPTLSMDFRALTRWSEK